MASLGPWVVFFPVNWESAWDPQIKAGSFLSCLGSSFSQLSFVLIQLGVLCLAQRPVIQTVICSVANLQCVCIGQNTGILSQLGWHLSLGKVRSSHRPNSSVSCGSAKTALAKKSQRVIENSTNLQSPYTTDIVHLLHILKWNICIYLEKRFEFQVPEMVSMFLWNHTYVCWSN